jgi:hypothetical protein
MYGHRPKGESAILMISMVTIYCRRAIGFLGMIFALAFKLPGVYHLEHIEKKG